MKYTSFVVNAPQCMACGRQRGKCVCRTANQEGPDLVKVAKALGVTTDPKADPVAWMSETRGLLEAALAALNGDAPADDGEEEGLVPGAVPAVGNARAAVGNVRVPSWVAYKEVVYDADALLLPPRLLG